MIGLHSKLRTGVRALEDVSIDGFASFDVSHYFPNNITISIASRSLYMLEMTHATLRRSGRMTESQRVRRAEIDGSMRYERGALERSFTE
ncbi:MAG TPA: hypothetical protein VLH39_05540, partial [Magnetospirillaceae bacterium]|nr:hypothetical protein [Magnetospirillaceae bacterium]